MLCWDWGLGKRVGWLEDGFRGGREGCVGWLCVLMLALDM